MIMMRDILTAHYLDETRWALFKIMMMEHEELRGILAIMAAEQEKTHLRIQAIGRNN